MLYKLSVGLVAMLAMLFAAACHDGSNSTTEAELEAEAQVPIFETMSELPNATGRMAGAQNAIASSNAGKAVQSGQGIFDIDSSNSIESVAACETLNMLKGGLGVAVELDLGLCFLKYMDAMGGFDDIGLDDSEWHIVELESQDADAEGARAKLRLMKDSSGAITSLDMYLCLEFGDDGYMLVEHVRQEVDGNSFSHSSMGQFDNFGDEARANLYVAMLEGELNADADFVSKEMQVVYVHEDDDGGAMMNSEISQAPGSFGLSGFRILREGGEFSISLLYAEGDLLGDALLGVSSLSIGDGSANFEQYDLDGEVLSGGVASWFGDDLSSVDPASDGPYYVGVSEGELPSLPEGSGSGELSEVSGWDCTDDVGAGVQSVSMPSEAELNIACEAYQQSVSMFRCEDAGSQFLACSTGICDLPQLEESGQVDVCLSCYPGGVADAGTLDCLINNLCEGEQDCISGVTAACQPLETRCDIAMCHGTVECEACFQDGVADENTGACILAMCPPDDEDCMMFGMLMCMPE